MKSSFCDISVCVLSQALCSVGLFPSKAVILDNYCCLHWCKTTTLLFPLVLLSRWCCCSCFSRMSVDSHSKDMYFCGMCGRLVFFLISVVVAVVIVCVTIFFLHHYLFVWLLGCRPSCVAKAETLNFVYKLSTQFFQNNFSPLLTDIVGGFFPSYSSPLLTNIVGGLVGVCRTHSGKHSQWNWVGFPGWVCLCACLCISFRLFVCLFISVVLLLCLVKKY